MAGRITQLHYANIFTLTSPLSGALYPTELWAHIKITLALSPDIREAESGSRSNFNK